MRYIIHKTLGVISGRLRGPPPAGVKAVEVDGELPPYLYRLEGKNLEIAEDAMLMIKSRKHLSSLNDEFLAAHLTPTDYIHARLLDRYLLAVAAALTNSQPAPSIVDCVTPGDEFNLAARTLLRDAHAQTKAAIQNATTYAQLYAAGAELQHNLPAPTVPCRPVAPA